MVIMMMSGCMVLWAYFLVHLGLAPPVQAQTLCTVRSRCGLSGSWGYRMHKLNGSLCEEYCSAGRTLKTGWKCGRCPSTPTSRSPPTSPTSPVLPPVSNPPPVPPPMSNPPPVSPPVSSPPPVSPPVPIPPPVPPPVSIPPPVPPPVSIPPPVSPPVSNPRPVSPPVSNPPPVSPPVSIPPPVLPPVSIPPPVPPPVSIPPPVPPPVSLPPPVSPPVSNPPPMTSPTIKPPTTPIGNLPAGPYIAAGYSERITLPQPLVPKSLSTPLSNCPHLVLPLELKDWHTSSTWPNGSVPQAGQAVTIPPNTKVLIQKTVMETLGLITIPATSSLVIGEAPGGIELKATGIDVVGSLIAGSETCLIETPISITLHGARPSNPVQTQPAATYKGISVTGVLSLHGKRYYRTWTRLSKTVLPGEKVLLLQDPVNWEPGQKIVVTTTAMKDSREWHQNEVHTVVQVDSPNPVSGVGAAIALSSPMLYRHTANKGYQAEVGLLTRTIIVQGSATDSEPTDKDPLTCTLPNNEDRYNDKGMPCGYTEITGFGGHIMVHQKGKGYVEGVEFFRMGQTNVLGRYPIHFHLLGSCPECYLRDSSIHRSFYRCISIHGTNNVTVTENVAYDVTGYCYYLEDGVEQGNTISFNLAAHIHAIGPRPPGGGGTQTLPVVQQGPTLTLPADVTASGFYITNVHNNIIGNAASGGWAGFAFPLLTTALQTFRNELFRPSSVTGLTIDGNTAHSSGWWWGHGSAFYFGGSLYYNGNGVLEYNPGRSGERSTCRVNNCALGNCESWGCPEEDRTVLRITNNKAFLVAGVGLNSWTGNMEMVGWESHDTGLAIESLAGGFWIDKALAVCRTGEDFVMPKIPNWWQRIGGTGFVWYDTDQEHIITDSTFRNCGFRSDEFNQYDTSVDRGCGDTDRNGCHPDSTTFGFLTHSDQFTPELMQGTRAIKFEKCGRRFSLKNWLGADTVSGRAQNWLDVDGSASGRGVPTLMVSGSASAAKWWIVDDNVGYDTQGPLRFINVQPKVGAPTRGLGHVRMAWDSSQHDQVGSSICGNGNGAPCPSLGYLRHAGKRFTSSNKTGMPITARGDVVGAVAGYGWILELNGGAPRKLRLEQVEVLPETPLLISIAYPAGTTINVTAHAPDWCWKGSTEYTCSQVFTKAGSLKQVRTGPGNQYFVDANNVLTFRVVMLPQNYVGRPNWFLPSRTDTGLGGKGFAIDRFERSGVYLPKAPYGPYYLVEANCAGSGPYCAGTPVVYDPDVCPSGFTQLAYDYCCSTSDPNNCVFAGSP